MQSDHHFQSTESEEIEPDIPSQPIETSDKKNSIFKEVKLQLHLAVPLLIFNLFRVGMQMVTVMFVGHVSVSALAGAALGSSIMAVTGMTVVMAMSSALDTLCGQAYGAKQYRLVGIHMQRAAFIQLVTCIVLTTIWANTSRILKAVGQDAEIANIAGMYAWYLIPCVYGHAILHSQVRFLQTQSLAFPMMIMSAFTVFFHLLLCWVMIVKSKLGIRGAALSISISAWLNVLVYTLYIKFSGKCNKTWPGFSMEAFSGMKYHLKLAIPSTLMVCLEVWAIELMVILSGLLPNPKLQTSVLSIMLNTSAILFSVSFGFGSAISTRVSNELGAGNPQAAKLATRVVFAIYIVVGLVLTVVLIMIRKIWGYAYSKDKAVIAEVATMMLILSASSFINGIQCIFSGILRGCGRQKIGVYCNLAAYYLAGVPSGVLLAFKAHMGSKGLYTGLLIASFVLMVALLVVTVLTDWEKEALRAKERVEKSNVGFENEENICEVGEARETKTIP